MAGPGKDNITGDRYTLDLGVEPDLGNLLQNLTVANRLLDEAENKFKAISTVVGSTTQRVNELTRATQLFVTQTQRIRNEYQGIADASSRIGDIGVGGGVGISQQTGMGLIGAGMSPSMTNQLIAQSMMGGAARFGEPGEREENFTPRIPPPRDIGPSDELKRQFRKNRNYDRFKGFRKWAWGKVKDRFRLPGSEEEEYPIEFQKAFGLGKFKPNAEIDANLASDFEAITSGTRFAATPSAAETAASATKLDSIVGKIASFGTGTQAKFASRFPQVSGAIAKYAPQLAKANTAIMEGAGLGGLSPVATAAAGTVAGVAGTIAAPILTYQALQSAGGMLYNRIAPIAQQAQDYTRLTGGTSIAQSGFLPTSGPGAILGGMRFGNNYLGGLRGETWRASAIDDGAFGLMTRAMGFENPLFNNQQSQEAMSLSLGAGYQQNGNDRRDVFEFLKKATIQGFGDMATNLDLYEEAVDKAGGSTSQLTKAIDTLKTVAKSSDVSIQALAKNFKKLIEQMTSSGMSGAGSIAFATLSSTAYSTAATPEVRNSSGPDLMSPYMRAGLANYLGTSYGALPGAMSQGTQVINGQTVSTTQALASYSDQKIAETLQGMGFTPGMPYQEIMEKVGMYAQPLDAMGILPDNIDPNDYAAVADFIMRYTGGESQAGKGWLTPMEDRSKEQLENAQATKLDETFNEDLTGDALKGAGDGLVLGATSGALVGAGIGTVFGGPVGTVLGGLAGGLIGGIGGALWGATAGAMESGVRDYDQLDKAGVKYSVEGSRAGVGGQINLEDRQEYQSDGTVRGDGIFGIGADKLGGPQATSVEQWYEAQLNNEDLGGDWMDIGEGGMNMPIMNQLLNMSDRDLRQTYVKLSDGRKVNLANALSGNAQQDLSEADLAEIQAGLSGEQEMEYAVKTEEGNLTQWGALTDIAANEEQRDKDKEEKNKPDGSQQKPFFVKPMPTGIGSALGKIFDPGNDGIIG